MKKEKRKKRTKKRSRCCIFCCVLTRACRRNVHLERSRRDHARRRRCYISTVAKLLISQVIAPLLLFTLFLPPLTRALKDSWNFQERTLNLRDFGGKVAPRSNPSLPLATERAYAGRGRRGDTGDGSVEKGKRTTFLGFWNFTATSCVPEARRERWKVRCWRRGW